MMTRAMWAIVFSMVGVFTLELGDENVVRGDDFRVETQVFADKPTPLFENLTLFSEGVVYDFAQAEPRETTIIDGGRGKIILLDHDRKMRTLFECDELLRFLADLKVKAMNGKPRIKFLAEPSFSTNYDNAAHKLVLASEILTYQATCEEPKTRTAVAQFREFADWSARLNATRPGSLLPFARLILNKDLAEKGLVPVEIELALQADSSLPARKMNLRSKHAFTWRLLQTDQEKISRAGSQSTEYKLVTSETYFGLGRVAERPKK